jgi:HlyD family secretion protein
MNTNSTRFTRHPLSVWLRAGAAAALLSLATGCDRPAEKKAAPAAAQRTRTVSVTTPAQKTIRREIGQPGMIEAYERTPLVSRIPGYVLNWKADIGDTVRKEDTLAELWVPELVSELHYKEQQVRQAQKNLAMTVAQVASAKAHVEEAEAALGRAEANHNYWKGQNARFANLVKQSVLDKQTQEETQNQFQSAAATLAEAKAKVVSAKALEREKQSARDKAEVDIQAADADRQRQADLVGYATVTAPFDGIVTQRNINTKQFVQPASNAAGDVLYVIERTDVVRVFLAVPESDADWIQPGMPVTIRVQALRGQEFTGSVTRTAWTLNKVTRTLRTEVDLQNPEIPKSGRRLRPGMYAYGTISAEWPDVLTLPASAVVTEGDVNIGYQSFCFLVVDGQLRRTRLEIGARNDQLVEVLQKRVPEGDTFHWEPFRGDEQVVSGELAGLKEGQAVEIKP